MSAKPAARKGDPTADGDNNPIDSGSPDVLFDGLPAAREGDTTECGSELCDQLSSTVLINGKAAVMVGSEGSAGNAVMSGSGTVIIGNTHSRAPFSGISAIAVAAALDYRLGLKPSGNAVLTPLEIPDFDELKSGTSKNRELVDFVVENRMDAADSVNLEVLDGEKLVYAEPNTTAFLPTGKHPWQWDGYDTAGVLDTKTLKSPNLKVRLTATGAGKPKITEVKLDCSAEKVKWVDVRVDRNAKTVEVTLRPSFSDGGSRGSTPGLVATPFSTLLGWAKEGIELYWSRNGSRGGGIAEDITTNKGRYKVTVKTEINVEPKAGNFPLIDSLSADFGRSTSLAIARKVYHNAGYAFDQLVKRQGLTAADAANFAQEEFKETSAHEFGHLILNKYGGGLIPSYSWTHKETSTLMQTPKTNHPTPSSGEVDVMYYFSSYTQSASSLQKRMAASEQDVKSLLWLARVKFDD